MWLHATPFPKSFLESPGQKLSEYIAFSSGEGIFARLDFREHIMAELDGIHKKNDQTELHQNYENISLTE